MNKPISTGEGNRMNVQSRQGRGGAVSVDPTVMLSDEDRERCESTQTDKLGFVDLNSKYRILSLFQNEADPLPRFT